MNFFIKYTRSNIKTNKMRAALLICCIGFVSILFFVSMVFPVYLKNYQEQRLRSYFGNSDIYIQANTNSSKMIDSLDFIPEELQSQFEYCYGFISIPSTYKDKPITLVAGYFEEVQNFNPVKVVSGNTNNFTGKKVIITESAAKEYDWHLGQTVLLTYPGIGSQLSAADRAFTVVAIVANEGLLSSENETAGPIVFLAKDGVFSLFRKVGESVGLENPESLSDSELNKFFNTCVIKLKDGVDVQGVSSELERIYPEYEVSETVNNATLKQLVSYLRLPFVACIYLVCTFCVLIIYLTCKLTFSERVRQFATLKSMGATTGNLFFSLLLESAFYGFVGGLIGVILGILQVYGLPLIAPQMTYVTPAPIWMYVVTFLFGIAITVASSFSQALKNAKKSIKETMTKQEKFASTNKIVSYVALGIFSIVAILMLSLIQMKTKWLSIVMFLISLSSLIIILPLILHSIFRLFKTIFKKPTFEHLYMQKMLPSKNLAVANRLLFFGLFLVFMFSTLTVSLKALSRNGQTQPYQVSISQVSSANISNETWNEITTIQGVKKAWKSVFLKSYWVEKAKRTMNLYGYEIETIEDLYASKIKNFDSIKEKLLDGNGIVLNKHLKNTYGVEVGDKITFEDERSGTYKAEFKVLAFIDDYFHYGEYGVCLINDLQTAPKTTGFNTIFLSIEKNADAEEIISILRNMPALGGSTEEEEVEETEEEGGLVFFTFTNHVQKNEIVFEQLKVPFAIVQAYSIMVLILCLLCIFIGYVLYLRESTEYHKTLFVLGMSPNRFKNLVVRQSLFMTVATTVCALAMSMLLYLHFENIFNALGTAFITTIDWTELAYFSAGAILGTTLMSYVLGLYFKRDLTHSNKRLFG